jgi:hypothetical protein
MDQTLRNLIRGRAGHHCEYCLIHQDDEPVHQFHIEHIVAKQHGGATVESNLALACHHCNLHKGPNLSGIDPQTSRMEPLFNPRMQIWAEHFKMQGSEIIGLTGIGLASVLVLAMNAPSRLELRSLTERNP